MLATEDTPPIAPGDELWVCHLGTIAYQHAISIQERVRDARRDGELPDTLLLLEHPRVFTRGRRSLQSELLFGEDFYRSKGIEILASDRGGRITYHAPGQLVGYPIMAIGDVNTHLRRMEDAIVAALAHEGVEARSRCAEGPDYTGVWVRQRKIASIGVHVSRAITTHGFAVNVHNDLEPFTWVLACGMAQVSMTSIERELYGDATNANPAPMRTSVTRFRSVIADCFARSHARTVRTVLPAQLGLDGSLAAGRERNDAPAGTETIAA
jgi:lipoyl(octanoyl) transferase